MKQQHTLQPKLRFPEFEGNWALKKYKEIIIENRLGGNYDNFDEISDFPLIKMGNIGRGNIILSKIQYLKGEENINNDDILKKGDLLFNTRNTLELVGKVAIWNNELDFALYNSNLMRMTFDNNIIESSNLFMNSLFNQLKTIKQLRSIATGTTSVAAIYNKDLNSISFFIPSLPEQQKIADYLSTIDTKINLLEEKKAQLALYKKAMMQKLFAQEIRFKDDNGKDFPEWEEKRLGEVLIERTEKSTVNNQYEILSSTVNDIFLQKDYFTRDVASKDNVGYKVLKLNQLVFSPQNVWMGNLNVNTKFNIGLVSPSYKIFDFKSVSVSYFKYFLKTPKMIKEYLISSEQGASVVRRNLNMDLFKQIKLLVPSFNEQQKIADFLLAIDESIEKVNEQISQTQSFKKAMLQQMFV